MIKVIVREAALASFLGLVVLSTALILSQAVMVSGVGFSMGTEGGVPPAIAGTAGAAMLAQRHSFKMAAITTIIAGFTLMSLFV